MKGWWGRSGEERSRQREQSVQELGMFKEQEEGHREGGTQWLRGRQVGHGVEVLGRIQTFM